MSFASAATSASSVGKIASDRLSREIYWEDSQGSNEFHEIERHRFDKLQLEIDRLSKTCWCFLKPDIESSYSHKLMSEYGKLQRSLATAFANLPAGARAPFSWFVFGSNIPGIFNLGGDLGHFAQQIRERNIDGMRHYGRVAVDVVHRNNVAFDAPIITVALVQGDALGGGFENALSFDLIVAERSAKLGLPEILFNLFPGMGAYSFLSRRMDRRRAEAMILSGRIYNAEELYELGVVDVLAEDGKGQEAVQEYIARHSRKFNAQLGVYQARRHVNPITREELTNIVDVWAETAMNLTEADLRKMDRLCAAQTRRLASTRAMQQMVVAAE